MNIYQLIPYSCTEISKIHTIPIRWFLHPKTTKWEKVESWNRISSLEASITRRGIKTLRWGNTLKIMERWCKICHQLMVNNIMVTMAGEMSSLYLELVLLSNRETTKLIKMRDKTTCQTKILMAGTIRPCSIVRLKITFHLNLKFQEAQPGSHKPSKVTRVTIFLYHLRDTAETKQARTWEVKMFT